MNDAEFWWEDDRTTLHAESLLESFAENLCGSSTLPDVFQIVDALLASSSWRGWRAALSMLGRCLAAALAMFTPNAPVAADAALRLAFYASTRVQHQSLQLLESLCCAKRVGRTWPILNSSDVGVRLRRCEPSLTRAQRASDKVER